MNNQLYFSILAFAAFAAAPLRAADKPVTFTKDIAPLVFKNCAACHRPGEVAPFSLLNYNDVHKRAKQIIEVTGTRQMPPWKPIAEPGTFLGERCLRGEDIALLKRWVDQGAVEGDPKDLPPAPKFTVGWQLGQPDLVVTMPKAYNVSADGRDIYRNFVIPVEIPTGKYIRAVEYRPGNRRVVHHAGLAWVASGKMRELEGKDGQPGFTNSGLSGQLFPGSAGFWVPGKFSQPLPDGVAFTIPHGSDILLQLHLHPSGKPEVEQSTIGFYFTTEPPHRMTSMMMLVAPKIAIPPGEKAYPTSVLQTVANDSELVGIFPHMHLIGKEVHVKARFPDGTEKSLLRIDQWDFNWQGYYEYAKPILLPRGTIIVMENTHDNSAENPANPNHPPRMVVSGEQTTNEMSAVVLHLVATGSRSAIRPGGAVGMGPTTQPAVTSYLDEANGVIRQYDKDGDGKLSLEEISAIPGAKASDIPGLIQRFDRDGDGKLDAKELAEAIATLRPH